jgi:hypothetical protein
MGRATLMYSNCTATSMMIIPDDYPREVMRSTMNFANTYVGIGILCKERHILSEILKKVHHSGSTCRIPEVAEMPGIGCIIIYELIAMVSVPVLHLL